MGFNHLSSTALQNKIIIAQLSRMDICFSDFQNHAKWWQCSCNSYRLEIRFKRCSQAGSNVVLVHFLPFLNKAGNLSLYWVLLLRQSSGILQRRKKRFQGEGRRILARVSRRYSRTHIAESLHWGRCYLWTSWFLSLTPAFSVTCIGDIFVYLSTCFVTSPTSKC